MQACIARARATVLMLCVAACRMYLAKIWEVGANSSANLASHIQAGIKSHVRGEPEDTEPDLGTSDEASRPAPRLPITVFTTLSLSRLKQLQRQCASWPGPLVAAVWAPIVLPSGGEGSSSNAWQVRHEGC